MKKVERYFYPAIFTYVPEQEIAVTFPDLDIAASGENEEDALFSLMYTCRLFVWRRSTVLYTGL